MYLFLPGNNATNKQWCESLRDSYPSNNKLMIYYDHWKDEGSIDWDTELEKIMALEDTEDVYVIGKSAGGILGLKAQRLEYLKVKAFIFIGFPYYWAVNRGDNVDFLLENLKTPSLFIQKPKDPVIGYEELNSILFGKGLNVNMLEYERKGEPNDDHDYMDTEYLISEIRKFLKE